MVVFAFLLILKYNRKSAIRPDKPMPPDKFPVNSTVTVKIQLFNDSLQEVWSSAETDNSRGVVAFTTKKEWMQGS